MYEVQHNFLSVDDCEMLIAYHKDNCLSPEKPLLPTKESLGVYFHKEGETRPLDIIHKFPDIDEKVMSWVTGFGGYGNLYIRTNEITKWNTGNKSPLHRDKFQELWSALIYLNDDFTGGKTFLEDGTHIRPEIGKCLLLQGNKVKHGVTEVSGIRYTLGYWIGWIDSHTITIGERL
ncbi:uncharacterized protein METZ01_LOCUS289700 [marine metagenome]|uniref:Prolyl 4-hydroxylase alpha subunit Fe(2+) 2OG dioxygenase domain-containing protein n=1 Tax=marine metagenome TaxID=408172 RepID=A0A382LJT3_9ZZZZ